MSQDVQETLRAHLHRRAREVAPPPAPVAEILTRVRRDQRRRGTAVALACAAAVALVAVLGPGAMIKNRAQPPVGDPTADGTWTVLTVPTTGDLADDEEWQRQAVRQVNVTSGRYVLNVVFAGHLPEGAAMVAAVSTQFPGKHEVRAYVSDTGSPADLEGREMTAYGLGPLREDHWSLSRRPAPVKVPRDMVSVSVTGPSGDRHYVVVPLRPTSGIEVSAGPTIAADGTVSRRWITAERWYGAAVGRLPEASLSLPEVRLDGGAAAPFTWSEVLTGYDETSAYAERLAARWGITDSRAVDVTMTLVDDLLKAARLRDLTVEPVFAGGESDPGVRTVAATVRLPDGSAVQGVAAVRFHEGMDLLTRRTDAVPAGLAATRPVVWLDDSPSRPGALRVRVLVSRPGAVRVTVVDTGTTPCAPRRELATGTPHADGLATLVVDLPAACGSPMAGKRSGDGDSRIQAVVLDASGREIGRAPVRLSARGGLFDVP